MVYKRGRGRQTHTERERDTEIQRERENTRVRGREESEREYFGGGSGNFSGADSHEDDEESLSEEGCHSDSERWNCCTHIERMPCGSIRITVHTRETKDRHSTYTK